MFNNSTIRILLVRMNLAIALISVILGGSFLYSIGSMGASLDELSKSRMPSIHTLGEINTLSAQAVQVQSHLLLAEPQRVDELIARSTDLQQKMEGKFEAYKAFYRDDEDRKRFGNAHYIWGKVRAELNAEQGLVKSGQLDEAKLHFNKQLSPAVDTLSQALDSAGQDVDADALAATQAGEDSARVGWILAIAATILAIAMCGAVYSLSRSRILTPLGALDEGLARMANGDFEAALPSTEKQDEISSIVTSVDRIQCLLAERAAAEAQVQAHVVESLGEALRELAAGQLRHRITAAFPADYDQLRETYNSAITELDDVVGNVADSAHSVQTASSELSSASADLAHRTETQAARLEATLAALRNLSQTVRQTAAHAQNMKGGADSAQAEAEQGAKVAGDAMGAMKEIAASSSQIAQITDVIDGIAFQTNLLALNAGVEAARAGDAGKGFAVVATEVRALAQRSADAAKSIKELIAQSGAHVERGVKLVSSSGEALSTIVHKVSDLKVLVEGITDATDGQANDLESISGTVGEMEMMTQQNAAMVEETSGAARNLQQDSSRLTGLVQRFSASRGSQRAAAPPPKFVPPVARAAPVVGNLAIQSDDDWGEF